MEKRAAMSLTVSSEEKAMIDEFAKENEFTITQAIDYLSLEAIRPSFGEGLKQKKKDQEIVQARISPSVHARLKERANFLNVSMKDLLVEAVRQKMKRKKST